MLHNRPRSIWVPDRDKVSWVVVSGREVDHILIITVTNHRITMNRNESWRVNFSISMTCGDPVNKRL